MAERYPFDPEPIRSTLEAYLGVYPDEAENLGYLRELMATGQDLNNRSTMPGHITAAAVVLSPDRQKVLMIHHNALDKWIQPGGHWDDTDASPFDAAKREALEETAVVIDENLPVLADRPDVPFDIDSHVIPASSAKGEGEHMHHDFRYVFIAASDDLTHQANEVSAAEWVPLGDPRLDNMGDVNKKLIASGLV